jgi:hypothetical protein
MGFGMHRDMWGVMMNQKETEHEAQAAVIAWARTLEPLHSELSMLFAVINGAKLPYSRDAKGRRYCPQAVKLKAEGLRAGVPDLCLPVARRGFHALFVEMKVGSNTPSPEQIKFIDALSDGGYCALVCWGSDEAIAAISEYLGIESGVQA